MGMLSVARGMIAGLTASDMVACALEWFEVRSFRLPVFVRTPSHLSKGAWGGVTSSSTHPLGETRSFSPVAGAAKDLEIFRGGSSAKCDRNYMVELQFAC